MHNYFGRNTLTSVPCDSFDILARGLDDGIANIAIMAIENSIAGSILQNYRILREHQLQIIGELYLQINHQLMALPGQSLDDIKVIMSHPMAINQCLKFLNNFPNIERKEFSDTALAAKEISSKRKTEYGAIASKLAADIYNLEILNENIETVNSNYTRFFIVQKYNDHHIGDANKASIYIKLKHEKGSLLNVLNIVNNHGINLSKLQSFPVLGTLNEYYFYLDLEFETTDMFSSCFAGLKDICIACECMGLYKKANISVIEPLKVAMQ